MDRLYIGLFKWYDSSKGFGVISTLLHQKKGTADIFFHHSNMRNAVPPSNVPLVFEAKRRSRGTGFEAINCRAFSCTKSHWKLLFENKEINLVVNAESGKTDVMQAAIRLIASQQAALNFIEEYRHWCESCGSKDIVYFAELGSCVKVPEFQQFIKDELCSISLDEKKELFKHGKLGLYAFSDDECIDMLDGIEKKHYDALLETNPKLFLKILSEKILNEAQKFAFKYEFENNYYRYYGQKTEYEILSELFNDYCRLANDDDISTLRSEVDNYFLDKKAHFEEVLNEIVLNNHRVESFVSNYNKLLNFPKCVSDAVCSVYKEIAKKITKPIWDFPDNIKLMSKGILAVDEEYIFHKFNCVNKELITVMCDASLEFGPELFSKCLFEYLSQSKDIDTVVSLYNQRSDIQSAEHSDMIKEKIMSYCTIDGAKFISQASHYTELLGEDFILDVTKKYLIETHESEPIIEQIAIAASPFAEKITSLLLSFHKEHPASIDEVFVEPLCRSHSRDIIPSISSEYIIQLLKEYAQNSSDYKKAMDLAGKYDHNITKELETCFISTLSPLEYMCLWEDGLCNTLPEGYLDFFFDDKEKKYNKIDTWLENNRLTQSSLIAVLEKTLSRIGGINYHRYFKTEFLIYKYLKQKSWGQGGLSIISSERIALFEWALNPTENEYNDICQDFDGICNVFILFPDSTQAILLKYIFYCIAQKKMSVDALSLKKLHNCSSEFMSYSEKDKPSMCLSVSVIIEALVSYQRFGKFITEKDFYSLLYKCVANGDREILPIGSFFDKCTGKKKRFYPNYNDVTKFIFPILDDNNYRWYIIKFPYDKDLVSCVKKNITASRYHPDYKVWFAPESSFEEIKLFAGGCDFVLLKEDVARDAITWQFNDIVHRGYNQASLYDSLYSCSSLEEWNEYMPKITWCEGRESQNRPEADVWWCVGNNPCNACAIHLHSTFEWEKYTLFDFCQILGFDLHEQNRYGHFKVGEYALFITSINRFNNLLERLYCKECGKILYPTESNYSVNGSSNFHCTNSTCLMYHKTIYLNHCYSKRCRGVIDSREAVRCPNGLVICKECGACCSTEMFRYRLKKLQETGSHYIPEGLIYKIENNLGHKEHAAYYCYKCGQKIEGGINETRCSNCGTKINYRR